MSEGPPTSGRKALWIAMATGLAGAAAYFAGALPFSNIDDYNVRPFQSGYFRAMGDLVANDLGIGRFRPIYWAIEGGLGVLTGSSGTILHLGRLAFLAASTGLVVLAARRLGAGLGAAAVLALAAAWCDPALGVWSRLGPNEAFAQPLALASFLLVLRARGHAGILGAALVGLAACLSKEHYAPVIAAALLARALWGFLRSEKGAARWLAIVGAAAQFTPALVAWIGLKRFSGSYLQQVVTVLGAPLPVTLRTVWSLNAVSVVLAVAGLVAIVARVARLRPVAWPLEDLVAVAACAAAVLETLVLGFVVARYQMPLAVALVLVAARGAADLALLPRPRLAAALAVGLMAPVVGAEAARAATYARAKAADHRLDERMRQQVAAALTKSGGVRIFWVVSDVERPIGALSHLKADGIAGEVEMRPCDSAPTGLEEPLGNLFAPYARPIERAVPVLVSTGCPGVGPREVEPACVVVLPGSPEGRAGYRCFWIRERAVFAGL